MKYAYLSAFPFGIINIVSALATHNWNAALGWFSAGCFLLSLFLKERAK